MNLTCILYVHPFWLKPIGLLAIVHQVAICDLSGRMTKKTRATNLKGIIPTIEEQETARKKRESMDANKKASIKASVRHYVKQYGADNPNTIDGNGGVSDAVIDNWLVWLSRCQDGDKTVRNERAFEKKNTKFADLHWFSKETLSTSVGENRSKFWLEEELLPRRPDRISGKHGEWITEYAVPEDWERLTEADFRTLRGEVEFALSKENGEDEFAALMQLGGAMVGMGEKSGGSVPGGCAAPAIIKKEPTPGEQMADKVEALVAQKDPTLQRMRNHNLEARSMSEKAKRRQKEQGKEAHALFIQECSKIEGMTKKAINVLERMCIEGEEPVADMIPKLVKITEQADELMGDALDWGRKFMFTDVKDSSSRGGKRKKAGD